MYDHTDDATAQEPLLCLIRLREWVGYFLGILSVPRLLTTKFVVASSRTRVDFKMKQCTNLQGGRPTSSGVCIGQQDRPASGRSRTVSPSLSHCPRLFPVIHQYHTQYRACPVTTDLIMRVNVRATTTTMIRVCGVCELRIVRAIYG